MIYLDNAATTYPKHEAVYSAMDDANRRLSVNAGRGSYDAAKEASTLIEETRNQILTLFHAKDIADAVFTPSVTHAINQVLRGYQLGPDSVVYITPYEHNAVARTIADLQKSTGCRVEFIPLEEDLTIDLDQTEYAFSMVPPDLVVMNALSNVTGYILPIKELCDLAKEYSCMTVVDSAQAAGLIPVDLRSLQADVVCFAGHKTLEGPFGIGGFVIRKSSESLIAPVFTGGTGSNSLNTDMPESMPGRYEASSQNIVAIAGLHAALEQCNIDDHYKILQDLSQYLINGLNSVPKVNILGLTENNIGIVSFVVDGYSSGDVGVILNDEFDIAVRTGYHCAPYIHDFLHDRESDGTIRVGLGRFNTIRDIDALIKALHTL